MTEVYYHIGLIKTGSTFLQTRVFPYLENSEYMGFGFSGHRKFTSLKSLKKVVISNETTSGVWYKDNEFESDYFERFQNGVLNIKNTFSNIRVIVVFREPSSFIKSSYKQYLHEGGVLNWEDFMEKNFKKPDVFFFSKYIEFLTANIDKDNLLILDFDDLKKDCKLFTKRVIQFIGEDVTLVDRLKRLDQKSNSAIFDAYEKHLIWLNKHKRFTNLLNKTIFNFKFKGRQIKTELIPRFVFPKVFGNGKTRDLKDLKEFYKNDWEICRDAISGLYD